MAIRGAGRRSHPVLILGLTLVLLVAFPVPGARADRALPTAGVRVGPAASGWNFTNSTVNYTSSVDGFPLSYSEILPTSFNPSATYPLAIELHGIATTESTPLDGGYPTVVENTTAEAAVEHGFLLIVPNTRTGDGYYVDSVYSGPQAQDILDAIHHEQSLRHIGKLYLYGFSMGTIGTLSIGLNHPGMFAGLGVIAPFTDVFELQDRLISIGSTALAAAGVVPTGGFLPNQTSYARGLFAEMSPLRFHPENLSNTLLYVTAGGLDQYSSDDASSFPFEQANNTLLNSTCLVSTELDEPANCTAPIAGLAATDPAAYSFRYLFEPDGGHSYFLLNATDMFSFFAGEVSGGEYWGLFPSPSPGPDPVPLLTLVTQPDGCGSIAVGGSLHSLVDTVPLPRGAYSVAFDPCAGTTLQSVETLGAVFYDALNATMTVRGNGVLLANFSSTVVLPRYGVLFGSSIACSGIVFNGSSESAGVTSMVFAGAYLLLVQGCDNVRFVGWAVAGGVSVANSTGSPTELLVQYNGTVTAEYVPLTPPPAIVAVAFGISPSTCGPLMFGAMSVTNGEQTDLAVGRYNVSAPDCAGRSFSGWSASSGISLGSILVAATTASLSSAASLTATYSTPAAGAEVVAVGVDPASCGGVVGIDGIFYSNSTVADLASGSHQLSALPCSGESFQSWDPSGSVQVTGSTLTITGNGSLTAAYTPNTNTSGGGPGNSSSGTTPLEAELSWAAVGAVVGAVVALAVAIVYYRRIPPPAAE